MTDSDHTIRVTLRDVYHAVNEVREGVAELTGALRVMESGASESVKDLADHEVRLRSLEAWKYALPGSLILGLFGTLAAVAQMVVR